jgi:hypothetical protein
VGAQLIGLAALGLAFVFAVTRLSIRRHPGAGAAGATAAQGAPGAQAPDKPHEPNPNEPKPAADKPAADMPAEDKQPGTGETPPPGATSE